VSSGSARRPQPVNRRFEGENFGCNLGLVGKVEEIAAEKGVYAGMSPVDL
jgi:hypothetical protein